MSGVIKIGATSGMRGHFPVMYDNDGPIDTGFTCKDHQTTIQAAIDWAKAEFGSSWENHCDYTEKDLIKKERK